MRKIFAWVAVGLLIANSCFADWTQLNPQVIGGDLTARYDVGMTSIGKDKILLCGGNGASFESMGTWIYEINKNRWIRKNPASVGNVPSSGYLYQFGIAYIGGSSAVVYGSSTLVYDGAADRWANMQPAVVGGTLSLRTSNSMSYVNEGKALLFGGSYNQTYHNDTWLYDAELNQWQLQSPTIIGGTLNGRNSAGMAYIGNQRVLLFGGKDGNYNYNDTWLYDLAQNQWTKMTPSVTGGVLTPRYSVGMAYIGGDKVMLCGGQTNNSRYLNEIWMYDLSDNQWTSLNDSRYGALPGSRSRMGFAYAGLGQVLMFGGYNGSAYDSTWRLSLSEFVKDSVTWQITPNALQLSWSVPEDLGDARFSIFRDGVQIAPLVISGAAVDRTVPYVYQDNPADPGKIYRYQIKEIYPVMNSEIFYPEIAVPYCR